MDVNDVILDIETAVSSDVRKELEERISNLREAGDLTDAKDLEKQLVKGALNPFMGRVVSIGVMNGKFKEVFFGKDEKKVLTDFLDFIAKRFSEEGDVPRFVGFHVVFDLVFLRGRCLKYSLRFPYFRYLDIRHVYTMGCSWIKGRLRDLEGLCGRPEKEFSGSEVPDLFLAGDWDAIYRHNLEDIEGTFVVFERFKECGLIF